MLIKFKQENAQIVGDSLINPINLHGDYDGSEISVAGKLNAGEPVPNDGSLVENIYFNTALSVEEVNAILDTIEFHDTGAYLNYYYLGYVEGNGTSFVGIGKYEDGYSIACVDKKLNMKYTAFNSSMSFAGECNFMGWNSTITGPLLANITTISESTTGEYPVGEQNDKLDGLIAITPFTKSELVIDMKELIEKGQIPLKINVTIEE